MQRNGHPPKIGRVAYVVLAVAGISALIFLAAAHIDLKPMTAVPDLMADLPYISATCKRGRGYVESKAGGSSAISLIEACMGGHNYIWRELRCGSSSARVVDAWKGKRDCVGSEADNSSARFLIEAWKEGHDCVWSIMSCGNSSARVVVAWKWGRDRVDCEADPSSARSPVEAWEVSRDCIWRGKRCGNISTRYVIAWKGRRDCVASETVSSARFLVEALEGAKWPENA